MLDPESQIWGAESTAKASTESVRDRIAIAQPIPEGFYDRCSTHQITHCMVCVMKERAAKEAPAAAQPAPTAPASQTVVSQPMPFLSGMTVVPAPEPVTEIVRLAQDYENAVRKLQQDKQLLVVAEARVEMLTRSIEESTAAAEDARSKLAAYVAK